MSAWADRCRRVQDALKIQATDPGGTAPVRQTVLKIERIRRAIKQLVK